jgi:hypothetical protein
MPFMYVNLLQSLCTEEGRSTVRSESRCALRLLYVDFIVSIGTRGHHFQHFYKCTATFRTQICINCLRIKLNVFRPL